MLKELKFVQGAVAKKDFVPAMTHFRIEGGKVRAFNGTLALCAPIALDLDCTPKAVPLVRAIEQCNDTISISLTGANRLRIQSGPFKAFVENIETETPHIQPEGDEVPLNGEAFLLACKTLKAFIGKDASRPWSNGLLLKGASAFTTNNVCIAEYWIGTQFPYIVSIPEEAVAEIVRIDEAPVRVQMNAGSITFHYTDDRWIRSQLLDIAGWPHDKIIELLNAPSNATPIDARLFEGIETLRKMADGSSRVYVKGGKLRTHTGELEGAEFDITGLGWEGCYQISMLSLLKDVVTHADFTTYPSPCLFFGANMRGAIVGMRM